MPSKNSLIVKSNIEDYIVQIVEQNKVTNGQLNEIDHLIVSREQTLQTLISSFEEFLREYEKRHPKNKKWHDTLKVAKSYLANKEF